MIEKINNFITQVYLLLDDISKSVKEQTCKIQDPDQLFQLRKMYKDSDCKFRDSLSVCSTKLAKLAEILEDIEIEIKKEKSKRNI